MPFLVLLSPIDIFLTRSVLHMIIVDLETEEVVRVTDVAPADIGLAGSDIRDRDTDKTLIVVRKCTGEEK